MYCCEDQSICDANYLRMYKICVLQPVKCKDSFFDHYIDHIKICWLIWERYLLHNYLIVSFLVTVISIESKYDMVSYGAQRGAKPVEIENKTNVLISIAI